MLEVLVNVNPQLYEELKKSLVETIELSERRYNAQKGSYSARFFRPDDTFFGGTKDVYTGTYKNGVDTGLLGLNYKYRVPIGETWISYGWYCEANLGGNGILKVYREGILKSHVIASLAYNNVNPKHFFFDISCVLVFFENDEAYFVIRNESGIDLYNVKIFPILYRIAPRARLNLVDDYSYTDIIKPTPQPVLNTLESKIESIMALKKHDINHKVDVLSEAIEKVGNFIRKVERQEKPIDYVPIKQENGHEEIEPRQKLDPNYQEWLEELHNIKVCDFCGSKIEREASSKYCHYCGVKLHQEEEEKEKKKQEKAWETLLTNLNVIKNENIEK